MWDAMIEKYRRKYGPSSMDRVIKLLYETPKDRRSRDPAQRGAQYILPGFTSKLLSIDAYADFAAARQRFKAHHAAIRREITEYMARTGRPEAHGGYDTDNRWRIVYLSRVGREDSNVTRFFPDTMTYIESCRSILYPVAGMSFSVLEPGCAIAPHSDRTNVFIHFHQGVIVPPSCGLRVGGQEVAFEEGGSYLFDPSFLHEAWNRSGDSRIHLLLPVWHPEITLPEREVLAEVFWQLRAVTVDGRDLRQ